MPKVALNYGIATEHLEVSDSTWRLIKPIPPHTKRLIDAANGVVMPKSTYKMGTQLWLLGPNGSPLTLNGQKVAVCLGSGHETILANELQWGSAWLLPYSAYENAGPGRSPATAAVPPIGQYAVAPIIDPSNIYVGYFVRSTLSLGVARGRITFGWVWKAEKNSKGYFVILTTGEACWGMGATAGAGVGIFTGIPDLVGLTNFVQGGASINVSLLAGNVNNYRHFLRLAEKSSTFGTVGKSIQTMCKTKRIFDMRSDKKWFELENKLEAILRPMWENKGNVQQIARTAKSLLEKSLPINKIIEGMGDKEVTIEIAKMIMTCLGVDGTKPGFHTIGADLGIEISVSAGYTGTHFVCPI